MFRYLPHRYCEQMHREVPAELASWLSTPLGSDYQLFEESIQQDPVKGIRTNPLKPYQIPWITHPIPWHPHGFWVEDRPSFTLDPGLHAGAYFVQDPSTMVLYPFLNEIISGSPKRILDLCAAPGGKSTLIASLLRKEDLLVCNEVVPQRYHILQETLMKWGVPNVITLSVSTESLNQVMDEVFDVVLVDAPCSGEGMFRKEPVALSQWSPGLVRHCALRQEKILDAAWDLVAPGGILIYATCTYNQFENMDQIDRLLATQSEATPIEIKSLPAEVDTIYQGNAVGFQCWPHRIAGEGFFFAAVAKDASGSKPIKSRKAKSLERIGSGEAKNLRELLNWDEACIFIPRESGTYAIQEGHLDFLENVMFRFPKAEPLVALGQFIKQQFVPHPALALSTVYARAFPDLELDREQALAFLGQQALPIKFAPGWLRITYQNLGLGWVKSVGNRLNNYYPKYWRIRHLPSDLGPV